jgi:predicted lipoprotein with Yx(FWY)xxD motif
MTRTTYAFTLLAVAGALVIAGCGGSDSESSSSSETVSSSSSGGAMVLTGTSIQGLGAVLVDSEGFTVYSFAKDQGTTSSCYGACAENWPPVITEGAPTAGEGAMSSQLGTAKRKDGTLQVTYAGHPLYTFVKDENPGEANGNELNFFGGEWLALDESGATVEGQASSEAEAAPTESSESSGGVYGY